MINKRKVPSDLEVATKAAEWQLNNDCKDIIVTLPDQAVYPNMTAEEAEKHPVLSTKKIIVVKKDGKILLNADSEDTEVETPEVKVKGKKK